MKEGGLITIKQLEYFLAVVSCHSFTAAAEKCYTSQPNLSRQIDKLENSFGKKLLWKIDGRLELTAAGQLLARKGYDLLREYNELIAILSSPDVQPEITFGYIAEYPVLNALMAYAGNSFEGYSIKWVHGGVSWLLDTGSIDMCFTFEKQGETGERFVKLFDVPIRAVVPNQLFPACKSLNMRLLERYPIMHSYGQITDKCKSFFAEHSLQVDATEFSYIVFDVDSYLHSLKRENKIGFLPLDHREYAKSGFQMVEVDGMASTVPLGIRWSEKKDADCRIIAEKLQRYYKKNAFSIMSPK